MIAQTSFEDGEGGIVVDGHQLTAPYLLDVIGDPDTLATALNFAGGFTYDVEVDEGEVKVDKRQKVDITVVRQPVAPRYAIPTGEQ